MRFARLVAALLALGLSPSLLADVVTDWNERACAIVGKLGPGAPGHRAMAFVQVAVFEAVNSIDPRYTPYMQRIPVSPGASVDAAVAAANRAVLLAMVPADKAAIESAYQDAVAKIPEGQAKADGIAVGEKAGALMVTRAAADGAIGPDNYAWQAQPGRYVPTMIPAVTTWPRRAPWIMDKTSQFRPGPPPALDSEMWEKDFHEVKALGGKTSATRTPEQTAIAQFWEETRPLVYYPVLKSVAMMPGRTVTQNARLYAAAGMAMDDALIAVFDAKYHYNFWRPVTAARMEHTAGKTKVAADLGWTPFISTPMHPEYPCAHCVVSGSMGAVLQAELGSTPAPVMSAASPTANGATREWKTVPAFMEEVKMARIYDGVHYRNSTVVGNDIGMKVGDLVQKRFASPARY